MPKYIMVKTNMSLLEISKKIKQNQLEQQIKTPLDHTKRFGIKNTRQLGFREKNSTPPDIIKD